MIQIGFRVSEELKLQMDEFCQKHSISQQELVTAAATKYLELPAGVCSAFISMKRERDEAREALSRNLASPIGVKK